MRSIQKTLSISLKNRISFNIITYWIKNADKIVREELKERQKNLKSKELKIVEMDEFKNIRINLVTINTPVRDDYQLTEHARERGSHHNIYDSKDPVQTKGGNSWFTFPAKPSKVKLTGEYGNARREFDKGATNIRVNNPQGILGDFHNSHNRTNDWINRKEEQAIDSTKFWIKVVQDSQIS